MNASAEESARLAVADQRPAEQWLEALSSGACDQARFLQVVDPLVNAKPDAAWEVLALLDQYHRRGAIESGQFRALKAHIAQEGMNAERRAGVSTGIPLTPRQSGDTSLSPTFAPSAPPPSAMRPQPASPVIAVLPEPIVREGTFALRPRDLVRGRYRLLALLGQGRTGTVFEASDEYQADPALPAQRVALKVLSPAVTNEPAALARVLWKFRQAQALSHPNLLRVHHFEQDGDLAFLTMEVLRGKALSELLGVPGALERSHALAILRDVGSALLYAHSRGVIHGDIKPGNIFITDDGDARLLRFGEANAMPANPSIDDRDLLPLTADPPIYASCQVLAGRTPEARDDLYSLACVACLLFSGRHPFDARTAMEARARRLKPRRPPSLRRRQWRALRSALRFERGERDLELREWLDRLEVSRAAPRLPPASSLRPTPRTRRGLVLRVASAGLVVVALAGIWIALGRPSAESAATEARASLASTEAALVRGWHAALEGAPAVPLAKDVGEAKTPPPAVEAARPAPAEAASARAVRPARGAAGREASAAATAASPEDQFGASLSADDAADLGLARIELATDLVGASPGAPVARVIVRRTGSLRGEVTFTWWTRPGSGNAYDNFVAFGPRVAHIREGEEEVKLLIPIVADERQHEAKDFYVVIGQPSAGASLGARTHSRVIIAANP